ncbi:hypothetical protein NSQ09_21870 [Bacillus sp. FSL W8-1202]|uniref:hypothetical protein n=1 Tax=Bacillus sp. FSL W8-1202 TaxID=2954649 RepID=UPI001B9831A5|nr:hypothetical protein [Bacillus subtilis]CAF1771193.1 hypothetical protein NRS6120_02132 [Bacillus subtilis]CAI6269898.1 hypothetical protein NRS6120_10345 [Bacillus subtilis]
MNKDIQFLKELQNELKTQDHDSQAEPRFWTVGDYEWVEAREENAERYSVYLPYIAEAYVFDAYLEEIKEDSELSKEALTELQEIEDDYDDAIEWIQKYIDEEAELIPERKVHIIQPNTMFLTKAEAKRHIRLNKHHYTSEAHTYAMTAWRAPKVERLFKILETFDWKSIETSK